MGEPGAGESNDGVTAPWEALTHPDPTGTLPGTHGTGCRALAKASFGASPVPGVPTLPSTEKTQTPKQRFIREVPEVSVGESGLGGAGGSALSLIPVSHRRVVTLEKKAEETFGFEIQVGSVPSCAVPCHAMPSCAVPCHATLPALPACTLLCIEGIFKLSLSQGLFLAVTELPGYRSLP